MASLTGGLLDRSSILTDMILRRVQKDVRTHMRILSVVRIKAYSRYGYDYLSKIVLRNSRMTKKHMQKDFKNMYPSDFEHLNLLLLQVIRHQVEDFQLGIESYQTQLNLTKPGWDATGYSDGTLTRILESLAYKVKEFKIKRLNPGMNTRFWTEKDVTRSNEFIAAIERRLKARRIYQNLECFVGECVRDIDYRLL
ncbi:hypothetical protein Tco_0359023 [Tanacetum coccineum]